MPKQPSFEEMCRLGQVKYQNCSLLSCDVRKSIAFNNCWDCTKFAQNPPEAETVTEKRKRNNEERMARLNPIGMIKDTQGTTSGTPQTVEEPIQFTDEYVPMEPKKKTTVKATVISIKKATPKPVEEDDVEDRHKPKKYMTGDEYYDHSKEERETLNEEFDVRLI